MASKTEGVANGNVDFSLFCHIESEIEVIVDFRIVRKVVYCWRNNAVIQRHNCGKAFNCTGSAQQVPGH